MTVTSAPQPATTTLREDAPSPWQFATADEALHWTADVLRARRHPRLGRIWQYVLADASEGEIALASAGVQRPHLPDDVDDRFNLAMAVEKILVSMGDEGDLLRLHAMGDWATVERLNAALVFQQRARAEGERVVLNHRFSFRQLGVYYRCDHKTAATRVREALRTLSKRLQHEGLLFVPVNPE